ncbi:hypothetical protein SAMN02745121_05199 [Nannocystis exedens]|uniref:Terpene synthase n=1 Tax=Nannocystis exedens TaxID=54 RepID=A0A1I2CQI6_9BACT|nr:terpene synthase family protein [Nannocystis exedens]PCC68497.1 Germacrene A synthase [Nannocystis exedens]SFE70571.1 hypothetical protein SAMN02745121_05199 [Nannocystis exedens]
MTGIDFDLGTVRGNRLTGTLVRMEVPGHGCPGPVGTPAEIDVCEDECVRWAERIGLIDASGRYAAKFRLSQLAALAAHTLPDVRPSRARWFIRLQAFIFTLDDALDNLGDIRVGADYLSHAQLAPVLAAFQRALAGQPAEPALDRKAADFPRFFAFRAALVDIRAEALQEGGDLRWFVAGMRDYFEAMTWEHSAHCDADYRSTISTYLCNREQTISYLQSLESFLLLKRVDLTAAQRERHPVALLRTGACRHVILVNDIFSLAKELACAELDNVLLLAERRDAGLRARFHALLREVNALALDLAHVARALLAAYPDEPAIAGYVETIVHSVNGHIDWYAHSRRYGARVGAVALRPAS